MIKNVRKLVSFLFLGLPRKYLIRLGFVNYYVPYINGFKDKLILKGKYTPVDLSNTIFNTMSGTITIEKDCFFSHNCMVLTGSHDYTLQNSQVFRENVLHNRDIYIEEGVWLAAGCIILGNVRIGKFSVVCAGAVVTKDMPNYSLIAGVPAKVIKVLLEESDEKST